MLIWVVLGEFLSCLGHHHVLLPVVLGVVPVGVVCPSVLVATD